MKFWKEHMGLRLTLITAFFVAGLVLVSRRLSKRK